MYLEWWSVIICTVINQNTHNMQVSVGLYPPEAAGGSGELHAEAGELCLWPAGSHLGTSAPCERIQVYIVMREKKGREKE